MAVNERASREYTRLLNPDLKFTILTRMSESIADTSDEEDGHHVPTVK